MKASLRNRLLYAFCFGLSVLAPAAWAGDHPMLPNMVLVLADDHAIQAVGAYDPALLDTPNLDRLAAGGLVFDQAFVGNSRSAPSLASVLTGQHSHRHGVRRDGDSLDEATRTLPQLLQAAGYRTVLVGDWPLGSEPVGFHVHAAPAQDNVGRFDAALAWLDEAAQNTSPSAGQTEEQPAAPWFLIINAAGPGALPAALPAAETRSLKERQQDLADYLAHFAGLDQQLGRLLDGLQARDAPGDTLLIYSSDQGLYLGEQGRQGMGSMHELSFRTPLLIAWPGHLEAGGRRQALVQNIDLAPTLLDLAGAPIPAAVQGMSLAPLFQADDEDFREAVYYHFYDAPGVPGVPRQLGVRNYRFKLIHYYDDGDRFAFYDLKHDPQELQNVYDDPLWGILGDVAHKQLKKLQAQYGDGPEAAPSSVEEREGR